MYVQSEACLQLREGRLEIVQLTHHKLSPNHRMQLAAKQGKAEQNGGGLLPPEAQRGCIGKTPKAFL